MHNLIVTYLLASLPKPSSDYNTEQGQKEWCRQRSKGQGEAGTKRNVFLALPNGRVISTHLVTCKKPDDSLKKTYPFVPAYSVTICKCQGQTLEEVIIWMDAKRVPAAGAAYVTLESIMHSRK